MQPKVMWIVPLPGFRTVKIGLTEVVTWMIHKGAMTTGRQTMNSILGHTIASQIQKV